MGLLQEQVHFFLIKLILVVAFFLVKLNGFLNLDGVYCILLQQLDNNFLGDCLVFEHLHLELNYLTSDIVWQVNGQVLLRQEGFADFNDRF